MDASNVFSLLMIFLAICGIISRVSRDIKEEKKTKG